VPMAHLLVHSMMIELYGQEEAKRKMPHFYGFAEASTGFPSPEPESWITTLSRRVSSMFAASVAAVQRLYPVDRTFTSGQ
jgi:hypothetical protein